MAGLMYVHHRGVVTHLAPVAARRPFSRTRPSIACARINMSWVYETFAAFSKRPMLQHMQPQERERITCFDLPKYFLVENEIVTRGEGGSD